MKVESIKYLFSKNMQMYLLCFVMFKLFDMFTICEHEEFYILPHYEMIEKT